MIKWREMWDRLAIALQTKTSWGKVELKDLMVEIERKVVRESEDQQ